MKLYSKFFSLNYFLNNQLSVFNPEKHHKYREKYVDYTLHAKTFCVKKL
jgi:hypothetical protein